MIRFSRVSFVFLLTLLTVSTALAYESPGRPTGFVNDFAAVLDAGTRQILESRLTNLKQTTGAEVAVVTVQSLGDETVETYAVQLFQEWGIGDEESDRGLLILVAPNNREARIEVGYGLEPVITDLQAGNIIRKVMIPEFQAGNYAAGITKAVDGVSLLIQGSEEAQNYFNESPPETRTDFDLTWLFFLVIFGFNIFARILGRTKSWWLGGVLGAAIGTIIGVVWGFVFAGISAIIILTILGLLFDYIVSKHGGWGGGGPHFWGMGGHSGFGGGFGGFGGGSSGGGGASGRW